MAKSFNTGVMIAFVLKPDTTAKLLDLGRKAELTDEELQQDDLHVTLTYLGKADEVSRTAASDEDNVAALLEQFAAGWRGIQGQYSGIGRFTNTDDDNKDVIYASFDAPDLPRFRESLLAFLNSHDIAPNMAHGYAAHVTLGYVDKDRYIPTMGFAPMDETFDKISLVWADSRYDIPLGKEPAMDNETEAAKTTEPADTWDIPEAVKQAPIMEPSGDTNEFGLASVGGEIYADPDDKKLPIGDAEHVLLAAQALGKRPPHGQRVVVAAEKLAEVKQRIRARALELEMPDEDIAKIEAYLSGKIPTNLSSKQTDNWVGVFGRVFAQTKDEIKATLAAQGVLNRQAALGVKSATGGLPTTVAGWMMLFSEPDQTDLQGTYFDNMTRTLAEYYTNAPLWVEHGKDPVYGADPVGKRTVTQVYPFGVWGEHELHTDHPLYEKTAQDAAAGLFSYSSDSLAHYAVQGYSPNDGYLSEWPLAGCSLTRTPAEPGLGPVQAKSLELALKSMVQQREADGQAGEGNSTSIAEDRKMDDEEVIVEKAVVGPGDFETPEMEQENTPGSTIQALAQMYNVDEGGVRAAMDQHIAEILSTGSAHPDLCRTLGLPEDSDPQAVVDHLNNLYSAATSASAEAPPDEAPEMMDASEVPAVADVPAVPEPATMEAPAAPVVVEAPAPVPEMAVQAAPPPQPAPPAHNYGALNRHLNSGSPAVKSGAQGPFMTGEFAQKGINYNKGLEVPGVVQTITDMIRVKNGVPPKYAWNSTKAMTSATGPTGGYVLRQEISEEILAPLRAQAVVFKLGAQQEDMQGMAVKQIPAMVTAPTSTWIGENQAVVTSQPSYRMITLIPHGLQTTVPIPVNVEANMTPNAEKQLREQMVLSQTLAIDIAALTGPGGASGSGAGAAPAGILNTPGVRTYALNGTTSGRTPTFLDLQNVNRLLDRSNVPMQGNKRGFAMHSDIASVFTGQTDALGRPLLRDGWDTGAKSSLLNFPFEVENQIPTNVTVGTSTANTSYVFFGDWRYLIVGLSDMVELRLSETFMQNLQIGLLAYVYADVKVAYPEAFVAMTGVLGADIAGATVTTNS